MPTTQAAMGFLDGSGFFAVLFCGLAVAAALGAYVWRVAGTHSGKLTALGAATLLACSALWAGFSGVFRLGDLDPRLWVAPFDRLLLVVSLITLTWALSSGADRPRRWRSLLTGGIGASLLLYLHWATLWARELHSHPTLSYDPTGLAKAWDVALVVLAGAAAAYIWRLEPRAPRWLALAIGGLALGSLLELLAPASPVVPVWSRFGALLAGAVFTGAALVQTADLRGWVLPSGRLYLSRSAPNSGGDKADLTEPPGLLPEFGLGVAPAVLTDQALLALAEHLGAEPGIIGLLTEDGDFDVRAMASPRSRPRRLGSLPLGDHPTLRRVLQEGGLSLASGKLAPDVDRLYRLAGFASTGPVLLQRIGVSQAHGVLIVGRKSGHWGVEEQSAVGAIARRMAEALDAATQAQQAAAGHDGPSGALAAQATALNRLTHLVEGVGQRMERIERELDTESSTIGRRAGDEDIDRTTEETVRASGAAPSDSATGNTPADASAGAVDDVLDTESYEARETTVAAAPDEMVDDDVADGWGRAAARDVALPAGEAPSPGGSEHTPDTALVEAQEEQQEGHGTDEHWSAAAHLSARVPRYERALERLPWAVVVVDALGNVAFANEASANLLRRDDVAPGMPFASALPAPERIASALAQLRSAAEADGEGGPDSSIGGAGDEQLEAGRSGGAPPGHASHCDIEVRFEDPDVRVELEPLTEPGAGYIGAVAVIHPAAAKPAGEGSKLVPELTDALRAPMSSILGYSDLLTSGSGVPEEQLGRFLHRIDANLARMQVMLGNLLTVIEIDDEDIRSEPVDVQQVVETAVGRARAQFEEKGLGVRCDLAEQLPPALAEPEALQQIVDNLLVNAAIRSPQGGDVTVGAEIRAAGDAESIVISVHDRGVSVTGAGSGAVEIDGSDSAPVALRIVRLLAARQGGGAWVESDRHGARFYVRLPVREAA